MYHNIGDISGRKCFDFNQLRSIAKVQLATLLHMAGYKIKPEDWLCYLCTFHHATLKCLQ